MKFYIKIAVMKNDKNIVGRKHQKNFLNDIRTFFRTENNHECTKF